MSKRKQKRGFRYHSKKVIGWLHLWLGLVAGIVVLISMLGAAVFVWEKELTNWYYSDLVYTKDVKTTTLPPSKLFAAVEAAYPGKKFTSMSGKNEPGKNWEFRSFKSAKKRGWTWTSGISYYYVVFVNPYTGQVVGHIDKKKDWITLSRFLHQNLLLKSSVGTQIVGAAALTMVFLALSGLVLWWPKNRKMLRQRLTIKWKARFKRVNWDIHSVGGFYTYLFLLFFAATGLTWSYKWWSNGIYRLLGNHPKKVFYRPTSPQLDNWERSNIIDLAFADAIRRQPKWKRISFRTPRAGRKKGVISASVYYDSSHSWWETSDQYYYHPETGKIHYSRPHDKKLLGEKWRNSNYSLHTGSIYGLPTKIIAFISALFFATLPVSGFLIWWGRKKKKKRKPIQKNGAKKPRSKRPVVKRVATTRNDE